MYSGSEIWETAHLREKEGEGGVVSKIFPFSQLPENTGSSVSCSPPAPLRVPQSGSTQLLILTALVKVQMWVRSHWAPCHPTYLGLSQLRAAIAKRPRLGGLYTTGIFFSCSAGREVQGQGAGLSVPERGSFVGYQADGFSLCAHKETVILFSSY